MADLPETDMNPESRELLRSNPVDWVVSRNRLLRAALLSNDEEALIRIVDDVSHVVGINRAEWLMISEAENLVEQSLIEQESEDQECINR